MIDLQSILGYSQGSPYAGNPYLDIHTPEGLIDMSNTPIDLIGIDNKGNKKKMKAGRKNPYRFDGDIVREIPMQVGGIATIAQNNNPYTQKSDEYMQTGGRTPIITNNPNDPRLRAYQDSLNLYNKYITSDREYRNLAAKYNLKTWKDGNAINPGAKIQPVSSQGFVFAGGDSEVNGDDITDFLITNDNKEVQIMSNSDVMRKIFAGSGREFGANLHGYKKPVQPIKYEKRPKHQPLQFSIDQSNIPEFGAPTANMVPTMREAAPQEKTNWSYTYPTGEYNAQKSLYFPDKATWESFIKGKKINSQQGSDYGSALGYQQVGGRLQTGGNPFKNDGITSEQLYSYLFDDNEDEDRSIPPSTQQTESDNNEELSLEKNERILRNRLQQEEQDNLALEQANGSLDNPYRRKSTDLSFDDGLSFEGSNTDLYGAASKLEGLPYKFGANGNGGIDCSGAVCKIIGLPRMTSEEIVTGAKNFRPLSSPQDLKEGTVLGFDTGQKSFDKDRRYGIDHTGVIVKNPKTGQLEYKHSAGSTGFETLSIEQMLTKYKNANNIYIGDYK